MPVVVSHRLRRRGLRAVLAAGQSGARALGSQLARPGTGRASGHRANARERFVFAERRDRAPIGDRLGQRAEHNGKRKGLADQRRGQRFRFPCSTSAALITMAVLTPAVPARILYMCLK